MTRELKKWAVHSGGPQSPIRYTVEAPHCVNAALQHAQKLAKDRGIKHALIGIRRIGGDDERSGTFVAMDERDGKFKAMGDPFFIKLAKAK